MPIKKLCCAPCCSRYREEGSKYCSNHREQYESADRQRYVDYLNRRYSFTNKTIDDERAYLYRKAEYKRRRKLFLEQNPFCQYPGCNMPSTDLHHDWPVGYDYWNEQDFNDESHWVALCGEHHRQISNERKKR